MIQDLFRNFFQIVRFVFNFGAPTKNARNIDEICRHLEMLQIDFSNAEAVSTAYIYQIDPHKLQISSKNASANANKKEFNADTGISQHCLHDEKTNEQNQLADQNQGDNMSISSDSDFEETLQNHFHYTPKSKSDGKIQKNDNGSIVFTSLTAFNKNSKSNSSSSEEGNFSLNITGNVNVSNVRNSKSPNSQGRKRRLNNIHFNASSPVERFCRSSLVASTPLSTKLDSAQERRLATVNSAVRSKVCQSKQRALLNLSINGIDSVNFSSPITPKDEARRREQGAIAKHIARIRTSISQSDSSKENSPSINNSSRYYSMRTSFGSNNSSSFNKLSP